MFPFFDFTTCPRLLIKPPPKIRSSSQADILRKMMVAFPWRFIDPLPKISQKRSGFVSRSLPRPHHPERAYDILCLWSIYDGRRRKYPITRSRKWSTHTPRCIQCQTIWSNQDGRIPWKRISINEKQYWLNWGTRIFHLDISWSVTVFYMVSNMKNRLNVKGVPFFADDERRLNRLTWACDTNLAGRVKAWIILTLFENCVINKNNLTIPHFGVA